MPVILSSPGTVKLREGLLTALLQVRRSGEQRWLEPGTLVTECTEEKFCNTTGVFLHLHEWSNSYVNFEMGAGVEVEILITKLWGDPIHKAVVHPAAAAKGIGMQCTLPMKLTFNMLIRRHK